MSYDANGNIQTLIRAGIDQLSYTYAEGNKLLSVSDATSNTAGFADGNTSGNDYDYWPDGSLKKDLNRGITDIQYNLLKLPKQISFNTGKVVSYTYTASGQKLRMITSTGQTRDYLTEYENLNGQFDFLYTPEGRAYAPGVYEYFHKDHLGNIRAVFRDSAGVATLSQRTDYDPWGMELSGLSYQINASPNRLKFNGKEALVELGGGLLDYGARLYDATNGRWGVPDPLAEVSRRFSPFAYGNNNPIRMIDPDGMEAQDSKTTTEYTYSDGYSTQSSRNSTASIGFEGVGVFVERDGNSGSSNTSQTQGDPPGKGQKANQQNSPNQTTSAATAAGGAISLGRAAGSSSLGRILAGFARLLTTGAGLVATLPFILEGDTRTVEEPTEDPLVFYHYTSEAGLAGIMATQKIIPNAKGKVYLTHAAMSPADAFQNIFLGEKTHTGRGDYMVVFKLRPDQAAQLEMHPSQPLELIYPNGTLKLPQIIYGGPNTIPSK